MAEKTKRLKRTLVHHGEIIDYYTDTVLIANGHVDEWDYIRHRGAAGVLPVMDDGRLLMVRQYRNALDRFTLEIPAGGLAGPDEPTDQAALRELEEETGYRAATLEKLLSLRTTVAFCDEKIDIYVASGLVAGEQHLDEDENIDVERYTPDELSDMIYSGIIEDAKTIAAVMTYCRKYGVS